MAGRKIDKGLIPTLVQGGKAAWEELMLLLETLGHMPGVAPERAGMEKPTAQQCTEAIASYQHFHGLQVDGELGPVTERHMTRPRCALPDVMPARASISQWGFEDVTYSHQLTFSQLSGEQIAAAFKLACDQWNAVCGLKLTHITDLSKANIWAKSSVIDGAGNTLAWSYLPPNNAGRKTRLEQRYDSRENWSPSMLVAVVCHEIGHAIGLDHSNRQSDLMAPYYSPNVTEPQSGDIAEAQKRYGKPTVPPSPPPVDPPAGGDWISVSGQFGGKPFAGSTSLVARGITR